MYRLGGSTIGGSSVQSSSATGSPTAPASMRSSHPSQSSSIARTLVAPGMRRAAPSRTATTAGPPSPRMLATNVCAIARALYSLALGHGEERVVRAVVISRHGGPDVLELRDWPDPHPGPGELVIGVRAVTVGRALDVEARARGADFHAKLPRV